MSTSSPPTNTDTDGYWGGARIEKFTPFCTSRLFVHEDTATRGWDDAQLQRSYCEAASGVDNGPLVIRNAVIFSHSMGNLVLGGALHDKTCTLDSSSHWYSLSAPWGGSKAAAWIQNICRTTLLRGSKSFYHDNNESSIHEAIINRPLGANALTKSNSFSVLRWLATELHYCDETRPGHVNRAYASLVPSYPGLEKPRNAALAHVSGAICGSSPGGLSDKYSLAMLALSEAVNYGEDNDGMVDVTSCMLPTMTYDRQFTSRYYLAAINHPDSTCRDGDGLFEKESRSPCTWIARRGNNLAESAESVLLV